MYMNQEDACDTALTLGLGYRVVGVNSSIYYQPQREPGNSTAALDASLALTLSDDTKTEEASHKAAGGRGARPSSPHSTVSSFSAAYPSSSTIKVKRENKDSTAAAAVAAEEAAASRFSDDEEEGNARKKLRLTKEQSALLEDRFKEHTTLNPKQKQALARQLNLRPRQVEVWFQNRRARTKLKQTEVDCEILKRCCEKLTDKNRRLQNELHELRTLKFASPPSLYMQIPAATLTLCPSCERIGSGGSGGGGGDDSKGGGGGGGAFVVAPKPHFFNPFPHPAAC